ncbi:flavin reductase family protein [Actinomadura sp. SCN-SB]|uniref:flavin reductase family protein n=1 Tax=Actinomadura sp. SCN-SB TaxID=3373092 RepID=UPI00375269E3
MTSKTVNSRILPGQAVDADSFRGALARHAAGVVIITASRSGDGAPVGLTATSFSSASLDPPLVSFYVDRSSTTWPSLRAADRFAVNILAGDQSGLADRFARRGIDRFAAPTAWHLDEAHGLPFLDGACAQIVCRLHNTLDVGDHILVVGLVTAVEAHEGDFPLLYHRGRYGRFLPTTERP